MHKKIFWGLIASCLAVAALAAQPVDQGQGSANVKPWGVTLKTAAGGSTSAAMPPVLTTGAPLVRVAVSTVSADSGAVLVAGNAYRIACSTDVFFRWGAGAQTAVTTDTAFFGPGVEYFTAATGVTNVAFITPTGTGFCTITTITAL